MKLVFSFLLVLGYYGFSKVGLAAERKPSTKLNGISDSSRLARLLAHLWERDSIRSTPLFVNGVFNPYMIYRALDNGYPNTYGGLHSLDFAPYPNLLSPVANNLQPTLLINVGGRARSNIGFSVGYAYFHNFGNSKTAGTAQTISLQNNLHFQLDFNQKWGDLKMFVGGGAMPLHFSSLTLSNKYFREPLFDRVPWEYFSNSGLKYENSFYSSRLDKSSFTSTSTQGFYLEGSNLPEGLNFKAFYGRTQMNLFPAQLEQNVPSEILAFRLGKSFGEKADLALNLYNNDAWTNTQRQFHDQRRLATFDGSLKLGKTEFQSELGLANLKNPTVGETNDLGYFLRLKRREIPFPFGIQLFAMGQNFVCLENSVLNANPIYHQGGFSGDSTYDNAVYSAFLNPAGMMASNRLGIDLSVEKRWGNFSAQVEHQTSREIAASGNLIMFPHQVNAYTRSRFAPWQQYSGPYGRVGNRFRMSVERIQLTSNGDKLKYFSSTSSELKYRANGWGNNLYIKSYTTVGTIGTSALSSYFNLESGFLNTFYQEIELMIPAGKQVYLVGYIGMERNKASTKTELSSDNQKPLNQIGTGLGAGIDYDFANNAGIYLRHRWLRHRDENYVLDQFEGQETVVEIKVTF